MHFPGPTIIMHPVHRKRIVLLFCLTVLTIGVNILGIMTGITAVVSPLFFFPVILASYWYPGRGLVFSLGISAIYGLIVYLYTPPDTMEWIIILVGMTFVILIGVVVALLSWNLSRFEQQLLEIIEFLPDATFAIDREGRIIAWNRAIEVMTGLPKDAMLKQGNYEYALAFYGERRPMIAGLLVTNEGHIGDKYPQIRQESGKFVSEVYLPHFHGERGVYLRFSATALVDANGSVTGAIESVRDITEQVMTESALENTGHRLNTLAGILRYDMSRKLAVLYGQLQFGVMKFRDPEVISFIADLKESVSGLTRQIDISRDFRDIGATPPSWIAVQDAIGTAAARLNLGNIIFHTWAERLSVFSDPQLSVVFYHLIHNALKETTGATKIIITYQIRENGCAIIIEDDGVGIPDAEKGLLFGQREDSYGRGLFLASEILSITRMSIRESGRYQVGARFEILVPPEGYRIEGMER